MAYKTFYGLILALLVIPVSTSAEIFREISFFAEYDNEYFDFSNTCISNNPVDYAVDTGGYRYEANDVTSIHNQELYCNRNPIEDIETFDISAHYSSSTVVYIFYRGSSPLSLFSYEYKDQFGNTFTRGGSQTGSYSFSDASNINVYKYAVSGGVYNGVKQALTRITAGNVGMQMYAIVFTNDNLDSIDTAGELYNLIDSVDSAFIPSEGQTTFEYTTNTRFTGLEINGTSTILIEAGHFLDSDEIDSNVPALNPTLVRYRYANRQDNSGNFSSRAETISPYILDEISTTTTEIDVSLFDDGIYDLEISFYNNTAIFGGALPFADSYIYSSFEIASGSLIAVGDSEFYSNEIAESPRYQDCSITNITNCFINALIFVFLPSDNSLNRFLSLRNTLQTTVPFGYFFAVYDLIDSIDLDTTPYLIGTIPFQDAIFTPLRAGIATILWAFFAFALYRRFKYIEF